MAGILDGLGNVFYSYSIQLGVFIVSGAIVAMIEKQVSCSQKQARKYAQYNNIRTEEPSTIQKNENKKLEVNPFPLQKQIFYLVQDL